MLPCVAANCLRIDQFIGGAQQEEQRRTPANGFRGMTSHLALQR